MTRRAIAIVLTGTLSLSHIGCAFTSDTIALQYTPPAATPDASILRAKKVKVEVNDSRSDKSIVSRKKNGYGIETATIYSSTSVSELISDAIISELAKRGALLSESSPSKTIVIEIIRFYNDFKLGFFSGNAVADLYMSLGVQYPDTQIKYSRQIHAVGTEKRIFLHSGKNAQAALNKALAKGIEQMFEDAHFLEALRK